MNVKEVKVTHGPRDNRLTGIVQLNGVAADDPLTPSMARDALRIAGTGTGRVRELARWDEGLGGYDYDAIREYAIYPHSHRRIR